MLTHDFIITFSYDKYVLIMFHYYIDYTIVNSYRIIYPSHVDEC